MSTKRGVDGEQPAAAARPSEGIVTTSDGAQDDGNVEDGIFVLDSTGVIIGGSSAPARNLISGNGRHNERGTWSGVSIEGGARNTIAGSYVGIDRTGALAMGNGVGIRLRAAATTVGGTVETDRNVISGNQGDGIRVEPGAADTVVENDYIGTGAIARDLLPNGGVPINDHGTRTTVVGIVEMVATYGPTPAT